MAFTADNPPAQGQNSLKVARVTGAADLGNPMEQSMCALFSCAYSKLLHINIHIFDTESVGVVYDKVPFGIWSHLTSKC